MFAKVGNVGSRDASMSNIGIAITEKGTSYTWPELRVDTQCRDSEDDQWSADLCDQPLRPGKNRIVGVSLSDDLLRGLDDDTRLGGVKMCARSDPYGVQCGSEPKVVLPAAIVSRPAK